MERAAWGYTILEVLIVLAITAAFFFGSIEVFGSQRGKTDFSQSMQDVASKMQAYATQVQSSSYPGSENYKCVVSGGRPSVSAVSPGPGTDCIFLGLAIASVPGQNSITAYTVVGDKNDWSGGTDSGDPANTISLSAPTPAMLAGGLVDSYPLGAGSVVKSSKVIVGATTYADQGLVGFYNGLSADSSPFVLRGYGCGGGCPSGQLKGCIEELPACNPIEKYASQWLVCMQDGRSSDTALLSVIAASDGITTKLNFDGCS